MIKREILIHLYTVLYFDSSLVFILHLLLLKNVWQELQKVNNNYQYEP